MVHKIKHLFDIRKENKQKLFIVLVSFLVSFAVVRIYSLNFTKFVYIEGYHIHHFYFGTASLALGGLLGILSNDKRRLKIASAFIGVGIGLFADEIGLLLNCTTDGKECAYIFPDSGDIILTLATIIIFLIILADSELPNFLKKKIKQGETEV